MGGSRFPVKATAFSSRPRSMTAESIPRQTWSNRPPPTPVTYNVPVQKAVSAASTPQFDFVPQQPRAKSVQANCVAETMEREASYFQVTPTQSGGVAENPWNDGEIHSTDLRIARHAHLEQLPNHCPTLPNTILTILSTYLLTPSYKILARLISAPTLGLLMRLFALTTSSHGHSSLALPIVSHCRPFRCHLAEKAFQTFPTLQTYTPSTPTSFRVWG